LLRKITDFRKDPEPNSNLLKREHTTSLCHLSSMPHLPLLVASLNLPKTQPSTSVSATSAAPASLPTASCAAPPKTTPESNSSPCPEFSTVAIAPPLQVREPALPDLQLPTLAANPYLPQPEVKPLQPNWTNYIRPRSGSQQYRQRLEALRQGKTYTRLPADSFSEVWVNATQQPNYQQWVTLLHQEATALSKGQGSNRLTVILGDSISQWMPTEQLSSDRFYLNQGISGDTSAGVLNRLSALDAVRPDTIYVMVGVNDLKNGKTDAEILSNLQKIMQQLHQTHPQAQVIINSVLPTRRPTQSTNCPTHPTRRRSLSSASQFLC
jgi:GDSL-like Lipase/Acylhydrolase family